MKLIATNNMARRAVEVYAFGDGVCGVITEKKHVQGSSVPPTIDLTYDQAQELMDSLMASGVRPTNAGSLGQVTAMQAHIDDLRAVAFKGLGI